jgi:hypothetical protein
MKPSYRTGELIQVGDWVKIGDLNGTVEEIVVAGCPLWEEYWKNETGEGVMLVGPQIGRLFNAFKDEDLVFVERQQA